MNRTIAIFGAGPVLGLSIARRFGREGFRVALVARTQENLDKLVADLAGDGIEAAGFLADIYDLDQLSAAVTAIEDAYDHVDAAVFSPGGGNLGEGIAATLDVDVANTQALLRNYVRTLNAVLAEKGVYAGAVTIGALIEGSVPHQWIVNSPEPVGFEPEVHPDTVAQEYWALHHDRVQPEVLVGSFGR